MSGITDSLRPVAAAAVVVTNGVSDGRPCTGTGSGTGLVRGYY